MDWTISSIEYLCKAYKRRSAGSETERACQDYFADCAFRTIDICQEAARLFDGGIKK